MTALRSAILDGRVRHRRRLPRPHDFRYRVYMVLLALDELPAVLRRRFLFSDRAFALARYRRADYLGPVDVPLDAAVRDRVETELGFRPSGRIDLVTNLRSFGYRQNPVSFYFCRALHSERIEAIVAEITNTPWSERHAYVLDARAQSAARCLRFRFDKAFHVSPFMPMDMSYDWTFHDEGSSLVVHMQNYREGELVFDATLDVERHAITTARICWSLLRFPFQTGRVVLAIYFQAARLKWKGIRFHDHPRAQSVAAEESR